MTKDVLVCISGLQYELEEDDALEVVTPATYHFQNGKHYIQYEEYIEENGKPTNVLIKISEKRLELLKRGEVSVHMLFEADKQHTTAYQMPFGTMLMGIHTTGIEIHEAEEEIGVEVLYGLDINYNHVSDCQIKVRVMPRDQKNIESNEIFSSNTQE